jgi:hypothetical protein
MSAPDDESPPEADQPPPDEQDLLVEAAASAHRPHLPGALRYHPAWHDLDEQGRVRAFELARALRAAEAALSPDGLSTTARAVLDRIKQKRSP